jgi:hypothetical protein
MWRIFEHYIHSSALVVALPLAGCYNAVGIYHVFRSMMLYLRHVDVTELAQANFSRFFTA